MIQLNLMKAEGCSGVNDILIHRELAVAADKVEQVYQLTRDISLTMLSNKSADEKHFDVLKLTAKIMALTQGL